MNSVIFLCRLCGLAGAMHPRTLSCQNFSTKTGLLSWVRMCTSDLMSRPYFKTDRYSVIENPAFESREVWFASARLMVCSLQQSEQHAVLSDSGSASHHPDE